MGGRAYEAFRRVNRSGRAEDSVRLRATVLATVEVAVLALWLSGAVPYVDALVTLVLLPAGAWVSYRRRRRDNTAIKLVLTVGAGFVLWRFFGDITVVGTVDDTREPLAQLFLAVQILHGFDLPDRRSLAFTMASSLALVALGGVATSQGLYGIALLVYLLLAGLAMAGLQRSATEEQAAAEREETGSAPVTPAAPRPPMAPGAPSLPGLRPLAEGGGALLRAAGPALLVGLCVFLILPRPETTRLAGLPFEGFPGLRLSSMEVFNPGLAGDGRAVPGDEPLAFNPNAYFGFAEHVDLRTVGRLSDDPVMRVRADRPRLWRGMVFDTYGGALWSRSRSDPQDAVDHQGLPVRLPAPPLQTPHELVFQTYDLVADTPNLVFGAADPVAVYSAARSVSVWPDDTLTTYGPQDGGTVYTVVSRVRTTAPDDLRGASGTIPDSVRETYLQLPELPQRVHDLAAELTATAATPYAKAEAVQAWLGANTEYTLDAPPLRRGADPVDHFLFESRQGWCEPIASAMVVLLRSAGVPARFVTGFAPGDRNPLTGWYTVRMSHAHAWAEVWVPEQGWVAFDPTGAVPPAALGVTRPARLPLLELMAWLRDRLPSAEQLPAGLLPAAGIALAFGGLGAAAALRARRRPPDPADAFERLVALLAADGVPRHPWQTPREYISAVRRHRPALPVQPLETLLDWEETRRYTNSGPRAEPGGALDVLEASLSR